ncbi:MAG: hypothetical protein J07HR59_00103 [Halorubrum sp. J07HR59]|nr:MAG: hypothetical protein J07HR59_00103 [Halorubrum sp. J07HR59]
MIQALMRILMMVRPRTDIGLFTQVTGMFFRSDRSERRFEL